MFPSEGEPQPGPLFDGAADAQAGPQPDLEALGPVGPVGPPRPASATPSVSSRGRSRPSVRTACPKAE
ncbi:MULTISPECIES: hypothetical protein [Nocardia]|uniref:hypothetical protein n=1 Tax=Nocardia TaxID=1817 RepID=UPI0007EA688D|nr:MULTISPECIES: hypothetical protein [Nocardia]MBF6275794.1 hypothetical protein [Nocardia nova]OBA40673.1 hypothetical protein A5789_17010 [Nocardia sp. 852002-51101_SCH5132738]OBB50011.1 hypothetical protein A5748_18565 [Nocardia sp. 852002-51244_SCH5132740]OBF82034.1 hypothetical protein A9X06_19630 [Mycobacterium sp. 852002-51759_SCH5129042]